MDQQQPYYPPSPIYPNQFQGVFGSPLQGIDPKPYYKCNKLLYIVYILYLIPMCCLELIFLCLLTFRSIIPADLQPQEESLILTLAVRVFQMWQKASLPFATKYLFSIIVTCYLLNRKDLFDTKNKQERLIRLWPVWLWVLSCVWVAVKWYKFGVGFTYIFMPLAIYDVLFVVEALRDGPYEGFLSGLYRPWVRVKMTHDLQPSPYGNYGSPYPIQQQSFTPSSPYPPQQLA